MKPTIQFLELVMDKDIAKKFFSKPIKNEEMSRNKKWNEISNKKSIKVVKNWFKKSNNSNKNSNNNKTTLKL